MKAKVLYVSEKGNHALLSIEQEDALGIVNSVSGFTKINTDKFKAKKGDEIELPYNKVSTEISMTEDGSTFTHLAFAS